MLSLARLKRAAFAVPLILAGVLLKDPAGLGYLAGYAVLSIAGFMLLRAARGASAGGASAPSRLPAGLETGDAFLAGAFLHFLAAGCLACLAMLELPGPFVFILLAGIAIVFLLEHREGSGLRLAFLDSEMIIALLVLLMTAAGLFLPEP